MEEEDDDEDLVVNDTVRTIVYLPPLGFSRPSFAFAYTATPSMALNPVQRADLQPTTRVVSGAELPGNYHVDSTGHIVAGDRRICGAVAQKNGV